MSRRGPNIAWTLNREFGRWLVIGFGQTPGVVEAECSCGFRCYVPATQLTTGKQVMCKRCVSRFIEKHGEHPATGERMTFIKGHKARKN